MAGRPDRRYHGHVCQKRAYRRRQRERKAAEAERAVGGLTDSQREMLEAAISEPRLLALVARAAQTQWRASAWLLERGHPERWALRPRALEDAAPVPGAGDDPFAEVDELAERRRRHQLPPAR
jgi:hypothetical protein